jgi:hypothetical protein
MARFCFYCGRELLSGEKCQCRSNSTPDQGAARTDSGSQSSGPSSAGQSAGPTGTSAKKARGRSFFNRFQHMKPKPDTGNGRQYGSTAGRTSRQRRPPDLVTILTNLQQITRYFTRPADTIRQAAQFSDRRRTFLLLGTQAILGGAAMVLAAGQPQFTAILQLTIANSPQSLPFFSALFIFLQGFGLTLAANLLLILIDHLLLRYLYRQPVDLIRLLTAQSPAFLYFNLFSLSALLALPGSLISCLLMLIAGFALAGVAHFLALRQITGFDENRSFILLASILLVYATLLAMLFNLAMPVIKSLLDQSIVL